MQRRAAIKKPRPRSQAGFFAASNCHSKIGLRSLPLFVPHRRFTTYRKARCPAARRDSPVDGRFIKLARQAVARAQLSRPAFAALRRGSLRFASEGWWAVEGSNL